MALFVIKNVTKVKLPKAGGPEKLHYCVQETLRTNMAN